jgi:DNA-directed RNA polymerase
MQHYAMMLRDEPTARAVNVLPSERPHDIYQTVAEKTKDKLALDASNDDAKTRQFAQTWLRLNLITRKLAKGPTMTLVYGAVAHSFAEDIRETVREERGDDFILREFGEDFWAASMYLARVIEGVIKVEAPAAAAAMEWLRKSAREIAKKTNRCVEWIVPLTGFQPRQDRFTYFGRPIRVDTFIHGETRQRYAPTLGYKERKVDVAAQVDGIAPNVIHSLDAAALQVTAILAKGEGFVFENGEFQGFGQDGDPTFEQLGVEHEGVTSFAMIHDGYGTHASDMETLAQCARNAFHWLYGFAEGGGETYLDNLREQWKERFGVDLDPPPRPGTLSPYAILSSDYFFA